MARSKIRGLLLPGAVKLRAYLDEEDLSVPVFCERRKLDRFKVQRVLNGTAQRIDVEFAGDIERATMREGVPVVCLHDWLLPRPPKRTPATRKPPARSTAAPKGEKKTTRSIPTSTGPESRAA